MSDTPRTDEHVVTMDGLDLANSTVNLLEELERELDAVTKERDILVRELESMLHNQPAMVNGDLFYPRYTPDGDDAGEEYVNPLSLIGELYGRMQEALAAVNEPTQADYAADLIQTQERDYL